MLRLCPNPDECTDAMTRVVGVALRSAARKGEIIGLGYGVWVGAIAHNEQTRQWR
jgi:hypothetical protein